MSAIARYIVDAVLLEHQSPTELAREHQISRRQIYNLLARFKQGGYAALQPKSRRPHSCPHQIGDTAQELIVQIRRELSAAGYDAGPATIALHLQGKVDRVPSVASIGRILSRRGLVTPQPHKRPRSSFVRFVAKLPNETWQLDATPWQLADGAAVEVLNLLDDHSRVALASNCFPTLKAHDVVKVFRSASNSFGLPASLLSDNAAVFTGRSRRGKVVLELELERQSIVFKHSTPYHPQTCGKVERFHQTLKRFLTKQPPAKSLEQLQAQLDIFRDYYNHQRPHRSLERQTPMAVFNKCIKAKPASATQPVDHRVRQDRIDATGKVTLRYLGRLRHIAVGRIHKNRKVRLFVAGPNVRIITESGELLRELTIDPTRNYQPLGALARVHNDLREACTVS